MNRDESRLGERRWPDEPEPTAEELAEAAALAAALKGQPPPAPGGQPAAATEEALQAVALLRYSRAEGLSPARQQAVWQQVQSRSASHLTPAGSGGRLRIPSWRWLFPLGGLAAAGAAAAILLLAVPSLLQRSAPRSAPASPTATELPLPPIELLTVQARILGRSDGQSSGSLASAALAAQMRSYRRQVYTTLSRRYSREQR